MCDLPNIIETGIEHSEYIQIYVYYLGKQKKGKGCLLRTLLRDGRISCWSKPEDIAIVVNDQRLEKSVSLKFDEDSV